jgi:hypothetical protein
MASLELENLMLKARLEEVGYAVRDESGVGSEVSESNEDNS